MDVHFFEISFLAEDWQFDGRDEVEDPLEDALEETGLGEVTGAGSGMGVLNIDVDATEFEGGLALIRRVLSELGVAPSTSIHYFGDGDNIVGTFEVYDNPT